VHELDLEAADTWDAFVDSHPDASLYHRAGWGRVIRKAFGQRPRYRIAVGDGVVEGVLPLVAFSNALFGRYLVSVPFLNRGGILATSERATRALLEDARGLVAETGSAFCELRHHAGIDSSLPARESKVSMSLPVDEEPDAIWRNVGAKVRNLVRKAEKSGLMVREGDPTQDLLKFYDVFARNMRDLGTPVYGADFFSEVFQEFPEATRLTLVEKEGRTAAAGICLTAGGFTEIHWAAARRELLRFSPNMLLYWEAISYASRSGLREFCFGRSTEGSGPHRFKKQWGAKPTPLRWEYLLPPGREVPHLNPDHPKYRLAIKAWQNLPLAWTRALGPRIARHLP
jgi:FemAB-related protein (PEP-CTERM system-associated)